MLSRVFDWITERSMKVREIRLINFKRFSETTITRELD